MADALEREQEQMAQLECMSGKPIKEAKDDVQHCIEVFRYFAGTFLIYTKFHYLSPLRVCGQAVWKDDAHP